MSTVDGPVVVTGCSSGIGRATALYLLSRGHLVYATAVKAVDVTDEESMAKAVAEVEAEYGAVAALVNNAGYAEYGPCETVPPARIRDQFETNFFGLARMCQLVLPGMRRAGHGRIVNISSVGGRIAFPGGGVYSASKFAVEAFSDSMRLEVAPFGVSVSVVEPNLIRATRFEDSVRASLDRNAPEDGPYRQLRLAIVDQMRRCFTSTGMSSPPSDAAAAVDQALTDRKPRSRYVVSRSGKFLVTTRRLLADRVWDDMTRRQFGLTRKGVYNGKWS